MGGGGGFFFCHLREGDFFFPEIFKTILPWRQGWFFFFAPPDGGEFFFSSSWRGWIFFFIKLPTPPGNLMVCYLQPIWVPLKHTAYCTRTQEATKFEWKATYMASQTIIVIWAMYVCCFCSNFAAYIVRAVNLWELLDTRNQRFYFGTQTCQIKKESLPFLILIHNMGDSFV